MAPIQIDPQAFGRLEGKVDEMHGMLVDIHNSGCRLGAQNRTNIRWVWSAVCGLAAAFGAGFVFLFGRCNSGG